MAQLEVNKLVDKALAELAEHGEPLTNVELRLRVEGVGASAQPHPFCKEGDLVLSRSLFLNRHNILSAPSRVMTNEMLKDSKAADPFISMTMQSPLTHFERAVVALLKELRNR